MHPTLSDQVGDPTSEHSRLAGTSTSDDEHRRTRVQHGFPLGWVEVVQEFMGIHCSTHASTCHVGGQHPRIDRTISIDRAIGPISISSVPIQPIPPRT